MQALKKTTFITGLSLIIGLFIQAPSVHALYSPRLSQGVATIQQHIRESQAVNGTGTLLESIDDIIENDRVRREEFKSTGNPGEVRVAQDMVSNDKLKFLISHPFDELFMVFNFNAVKGEFISNCLRDEVWGLEELRDLVAAEMIRAYTLRDTLHGQLLAEDYKYLARNIDLLRKHGSNPKSNISATNNKNEKVEVTSSQYFFGQSSDINYYTNVGLLESSDQTGCPDGEFEEAFQEVARSAKTLGTLASGQGLQDWGDIYSMAEANARSRAKQWIAANQVSLTIGGESGARQQSLIKGGGWDKFTGDIKTQLNIAKNMVGPATPLWNTSKFVAINLGETTGIVEECAIYVVSDKVDSQGLKQGGIFRNCDAKQSKDYLKCEDNKEAAIKEGIRCDRFRNTEKVESFYSKSSKQASSIEENKRAKEEVQQAMIYQITYDSVAEQSLFALDGVLFEMNKNIEKSYVQLGSESGEVIPTITQQIKYLTDRQCANKQ